MKTSKLRVLATIVPALLAALPVRAQLAVVDAPAVVQLVQQVAVLQQAVQTAASQLAQARQALAAMTGDRGMEFLLAGVSRNYLPSNWAQLRAVLASGSGGYGALAAAVQSVTAANAVLTPPQLSLLPPANQQQVVAARQSAALQQALAQEALAHVSGRFAAIQSLINSIATAVDQKAILDLQARISAELGMLQNEQTKLQILHEAIGAQDAVSRQQEREQIIAEQGRFASRFQPVP